VIADPKAATRTVQDASRSDPSVVANLHLAKDKDVIVHGRSLAEATGRSVIRSFAQQIADRNTTVEVLSFSKREHAQVSTRASQPLAGFSFFVEFAHDGIKHPHSSSSYAGRICSRQY
jgi:hypothetical protein